MSAKKMDASAPWKGTEPLEEWDPEIAEMIKKEKQRQVRGLEMIASEVSIIAFVWDAYANYAPLGTRWLLFVIV